MDIRDIIVWLGLIAIVVIIWDGLRRMKGRAVKKAKPTEHEEPYIDPEEAARKAQIARELPNGGARVRDMTDTEKEDLESRLNLRERVPMLMERVQVADTAEDHDAAEDSDDDSVQAELDFNSDSKTGSATRTVDEADDEPFATDELSFSAIDEPDMSTEQTAETSMETTESADAFESVDESEPAYESAESADSEPEPASYDEPDEAFEPEASEASVSDNAEPEPEEPALGPVEDLVVVHVMARSGEEFSGSSVLDLLLTAGLRHGPMEIFHYRNPRGVTEFSLANCVQPGTFDPDAMNQVNTPGVTLFMQLPNGADAMEAFDHMYEMARFLAQHLEGDILDEDHSSVTPQRIEYYREKIRSFERTRLIPS